MPFGFSDDNAQLHIVHYAFGGTGNGSAGSPKAIADGDLMAIPAGMVVEGVDVVVTTAVTGTSPVIDIGDDDDQNGFVATATLTAGAVSVGAGAYLASGAKKYYSAVGKEIKLDVGGTVAAGAFKVIVKGYKVAL